MCTFKKMKNKINYTVSTPHNQICTVSMPLSSPRQQFCTVTWVKGKIKESWNLNFFLHGVNRNSPKLQGNKDILTLFFTYDVVSRT